uniref:RING-type E3 ubiquitin transferase n=1 Tax=Chromera velia CCMP2878 TaxID=1169474 RepID=A0A0G4HJW3_9ALVE|eukprot:Cvel_7197.t1-p1 / transcript=Cvel_7197.t1 / gene=Cvel_7197 / organism=Chromera_velia_CCMP2878 / gene_product=Peptidyl-prolyl cis-trans isomerase-like 2, putative / transcript_product=Peptidyl-prolyl cis-trans isomerase-like 2, putative / location=Cvel_scaffold370:68381-74473(+) / protein_length=675 / sequence_SO=supercontig / SO=protein_coding / is_pseudo=false
MGKKQHSKDKMYIIPSEFARDWGGYKDKKKGLPFQKLPFFCCGISLTPFEDPVCSKDGIVFDAKAIVPFLKKYKVSPVSGEPMTLKDLVPLKFHKNAETGKFHCPITEKEFSDHTHIVANRVGGNVYAFEAIDQLNRKTRNWKDLITGEAFSPSDLIPIQNPQDVKRRELDSFFHIQKGLEIPDPLPPQQKEQSTSKAATGAEAQNPAAGDSSSSSSSSSAAAASSNTAASSSSSSSGGLGTTGGDATATAAGGVGGAAQPGIKRDAFMERVYEEKNRLKEEERKRKAEEGTNGEEGNGRTKDGKEPEGKEPKKRHKTETTASQAASLTSTVVPRSLTTEYRHLTDLEERQALYERVKKKKKKGYVRLRTSLGLLNLELHADLAPMACHNFILHCKSGYYNGTIFHRCIKNFMIQGGDPSGTGRGGVSAFEGGKPFADEFHQKIKHEGGGILSMANAGRGTNRSQFFITFKSAKHLDNKHTLFGRLVGGMEVLKEMEQLETDAKDRPKSPPSILSADVFADPFEEAAEEAKREEEKEAAEKEKEKGRNEAAGQAAAWFSNRSAALDPMRAHPNRASGSVGRYFEGSQNAEQGHGAAAVDAATALEAARRAKAAKPFAPSSSTVPPLLSASELEYAQAAATASAASRTVPLPSQSRPTAALQQGAAKKRQMAFHGW